MLSPAMTPMHNAKHKPAEVDWDQFDQNLFALTEPAMNDMQPQIYQNVAMTGPVMKKQRTSNETTRTSRRTSPGTDYTSGSRQSNHLGHKKDTSMAAPALPQHFEPSSDSNDGVSPVDLDQFALQPALLLGGTSNVSNPQVQPITPSMLMSLQNRPSANGSVTPQGMALDFTDLPDFSVNTELAGLHSPSPALVSPIAQQPGTPRSAGLPPSSARSTRDIRPRPIASAHSRSKSVTSSPALGPQRSKASPDLRPILPGGMSPQVGAMLASKSNYQHIVDGTYDQLNISYPHGMTHGLEVRRTSHKAAEQKRRDHLKECFEQMRTILPDRPEAGASKVAILRKGYEHILRLHSTIESKDAEIANLKAAATATAAAAVVTSVEPTKQAETN